MENTEETKHPENGRKSVDPSSSPQRSIGEFLHDMAAPLLSIPRPPAVARRRSLEEYHNKNKKFLEKMDRKKQRRSASLSSPTGAFSSRKVLESIEEDKDGLDPRKVAMQSRGIATVPSKDSSVSSITFENNSVNWADHFRQNSDDFSEMSSFLSVNSEDSSSSGLSIFRKRERIEKFEQRQKEEFEMKMKAIESKLAGVLDRSDEPSQKEKNDFIKDYLAELERERESLIKQWKAEIEAENRAMEMNPLESLYAIFMQPWVWAVIPLLTALEQFLANLPLTIGALGLSWVTMGTVWFKFMEEMMDFCRPVHYYSPNCTFPEYPGCFECDISEPWYQWALLWHNACSTVAGVCCCAFLVKVILAWRAVVDELSNPTTSTPIGVVCIATVCVFAGRGMVGEMIVLLASGFHLILAFWFLYMAVFKYRLWPDPGWFPNTVGLSYAAVKTFLYFPVPGMLLMWLTLSFFFSIFFVSTARVAVNKQIAAPVCWIGLSAPSITLYCLTLVAQPTRLKERLIESDPHLWNAEHDLLAEQYLPWSHALMFLSLVGLVSAIHALITRWDKFSTKPFSPAHVAFCFPTLSHTNAIQAYRSTVNAFSSFPEHGFFKTGLFYYWVFFLVAGTTLNFVFTYKFLIRLPQWTKLDTNGEDEPPLPQDTLVQEVLETTGAHESFFGDTPFANPAVLQANEAGVLVRVRRGTEDYRIHGPYVRTRQVASLGFDPTMDEEELWRERAELLDWVAENAPRTRNRTMSNQSVVLQAMGRERTDVEYGTFDDPRKGHRRFQSTA